MQGKPMVESAVSFLVGKLSSLLDDEVKLVGEFRKEVVFVKNELNKDEDEEDIIDDFLYRFEHSKRHGGIKNLEARCRIAELKFLSSLSLDSPTEDGEVLSLSRLCLSHYKICPI
ncbi:hypothetical protein CsatA_024143 [Cannabis sativa]